MYVCICFKKFTTVLKNVLLKIQNISKTGPNMGPQDIYYPHYVEPIIHKVKLLFIVHLFGMSYSDWPHCIFGTGQKGTRDGAHLMTIFFFSLDILPIYDYDYVPVKAKILGLWFFPGVLISPPCLVCTLIESFIKNCVSYHVI